MKALVFAALLILLPGARALAADGPPPLFVEIGSNDSPNDPYVHLALKKLPNGRTTIYFWGEIMGGDAARFSRAMDEAPKAISELVILGSPGGSLEDGLEIGRIIHAHKLATHIPSDVVCASACNFVFLGGIIRTIDIGGKFMVHFFHGAEYPLVLVEDAEAAAAQYIAENSPPDSKPVASASNSPPATARLSPNASSAVPPGQQGSAVPSRSDVVGKIPPFEKTTFLREDDTCQNVYTADQDNEVLSEEVKLQLQDLAKQQGIALDELMKRFAEEAKQKNEPLNEIVLSHVHNTMRLAMLRAVTMDFFCIEQNTAQGAAEIATFLLEMRMSMRFLTEFVSIANAQPVIMSRDQLRSFNITNTD
jgi:hypothetical protein